MRALLNPWKKEDKNLSLKPHSGRVGGCRALSSPEGEDVTRCSSRPGSLRVPCVMFTVQSVAQERGSGAKQGAQGSLVGMLRLPGSCRASTSQ